jgi:hypothetical protein
LFFFCFFFVFFFFQNLFCKKKKRKKKKGKKKNRKKIILRVSKKKERRKRPKSVMGWFGKGDAMAQISAAAAEEGDEPSVQNFDNKKGEHLKVSSNSSKHSKKDKKKKLKRTNSASSSKKRKAKVSKEKEKEVEKDDEKEQAQEQQRRREEDEGDKQTEKKKVVDAPKVEGGVVKLDGDVVVNVGSVKSKLAMFNGGGGVEQKQESSEKKATENEALRERLAVFNAVKEDDADKKKKKNDDGGGDGGAEDEKPVAAGNVMAKLAVFGAKIEEEKSGAEAMKRAEAKAKADAEEAKAKADAEAAKKAADDEKKQGGVGFLELVDETADADVEKTVIVAKKEKKKSESMFGGMVRRSTRARVKRNSGMGRSQVSGAGESEDTDAAADAVDGESDEAAAGDAAVADDDNGGGGGGDESPTGKPAPLADAGGHVASSSVPSLAATWRKKVKTGKTWGLKSFNKQKQKHFEMTMSVGAPTIGAPSPVRSASQGGAQHLDEYDINAQSPRRIAVFQQAVAAVKSGAPPKSLQLKAERAKQRERLLEQIKRDEARAAGKGGTASPRGVLTKQESTSFLYFSAGGKQIDAGYRLPDETVLPPSSKAGADSDSSDSESAVVGGQHTYARCDFGIDAAPIDAIGVYAQSGPDPLELVKRLRTKARRRRRRRRRRRERCKRRQSSKKKKSSPSSPTSSGGDDGNSGADESSDESSDFDSDDSGNEHSASSGTESAGTLSAKKSSSSSSSSDDDPTNATLSDDDDDDDDDDWEVDPSKWSYDMTGQDGSAKKAGIDRPWQGYNWNERFQSIIDRVRTFEESGDTDELDLSVGVELNSDLLNLSQDFISAAKRWGTIIVAEVYLPEEHKTIMPVSIGGIAGGDKYIVHEYVSLPAVSSSFWRQTTNAFLFSYYFFLLVFCSNLRSIHRGYSTEAIMRR